MARQGLDAGFPAGGVAVLSRDSPFGDISPGWAMLGDFAVPGG